MITWVSMAIPNGGVRVVFKFSEGGEDVGIPFTEKERLNELIEGLKRMLELATWPE